MPVKIISGGQTGADQAGLDFAIAAGIEHGGWCPRGRRREDGRIPAVYQLRETDTWGYAERTAANVREADATIIFNVGRQLSAGSALTLRCCDTFHRPMLLTKAFELRAPDAHEDIAARVLKFIATHQPRVLNIAGNREESHPGIGEFVQRVLAGAWQRACTWNVDQAMAVGADRPAAATESQSEWLFLPSTAATNTAQRAGR